MEDSLDFFNAGGGSMDVTRWGLTLSVGRGRQGAGRGNGRAPKHLGLGRAGPHYLMDELLVEHSE